MVKNYNRKLGFEKLDSREMMTIDLSVNDPTVNEGGIAAFVINSDERSSRSYSIQYETRTGTAGSADFEAKRGWITMPSNATSVNIPIQTIDDTLIESTENFSLRILRTTKGRIRDNSGRATILDNDTIVTPPPAPTPQLTITDKEIIEGNNGANTVNLTVNLSVASTNPVTVNWATAAGTATADDFLSSNGILTFAPGETSKTISVVVNGDTLVESDELFTVSLSGATNAIISDNSATVKILNDDSVVNPPPTPTTGYGQQQGVTAPEGSIVVTTNSQLTSAPSNAVIFLKAGTYSSLSLKSGQTVIGEYGTRITGTSSRAASVVSNLTLRNLVFDGFRPSSEWDGSLHLGDNAKLINCEVKNSTLAGIFVEGDNVLVDGCWIHHNQRTGIKTDYTTGLIVRNSDISYNNPDKRWDIYNEAGGSKFWGSTNMLFENNYVHHNQGNGLWFDYKNNNTIIRNNKTEANTLAGIFWEISYSVQIYDNQSFGDGVGYNNSGWLNGAAIVIENSYGTSNNPIIVRNNISTNSINGIGLINVEGRTERTLGGDFPTAWIQVLNNQLINSGKSGYVGDGGRPSNLTWSGNILTGNSRLVGL